MGKSQDRVASETVASADSGKMTLFRDDRQEDWGAIVAAIVIVALIVVMTLK